MSKKSERRRDLARQKRFTKEAKIRAEKGEAQARDEARKREGESYECR